MISVGNILLVYRAAICVIILPTPEWAFIFYRN